jgi:hypothetical protein
MRVAAGPATTASVDEISMLHDSSSVQANWESRINMSVEKMMKELQESWRSQPQNADGIIAVSATKNDNILKENLWRFMAERVFSKFKSIFKQIFKQERLGQVVELALTKHDFIMKPDEWELADMQKTLQPSSEELP